MLLSPLHGVHGAPPCQWSRIEINSLVAVQGVLPRVVAVLLRCFVGKEQVRAQEPIRHAHDGWGAPGRIGESLLKGEALGEAVCEVKDILTRTDSSICSRHRT